MNLLTRGPGFDSHLEQPFFHARKIANFSYCGVEVFFFLYSVYLLNQRILSKMRKIRGLLLLLQCII